MAKNASVQNEEKQKNKDEILLTLISRLAGVICLKFGI